MSAGSAICGRCFAVYQEGYGHVCATAQADWRSLSDDLAAALEETVQQKGEDDGKPCWCGLPYMVPYRGHDAGCEAARAALLRYSQARGER